MAWLPPTLSISRIHCLGLFRLAALRVVLLAASLLILLSGSFAIFSFGRKVEMVQELVAASLRVAGFMTAVLGAVQFARVSRTNDDLRIQSSPSQRHLGALAGLLLGLVCLQFALLPASLLCFTLQGVPLSLHNLALVPGCALLESSLLAAVLLAAGTRLQERDVGLLGLPVLVAGQLAGTLLDSPRWAIRSLGWVLSSLPDLRLFNPSLYTLSDSPLEGPISPQALIYATLLVVIWAWVGIMATVGRGPTNAR